MKNEKIKNVKPQKIVEIEKLENIKEIEKQVDKSIKEINEKLNEEDKGKVEKLGDNYLVYMFFYKNEALKIGKDCNKNHNRYRYQHYNICAAKSTLAKSLYNEYITKGKESVLYKIMQDEKEEKEEKGKKYKELIETIEDFRNQMSKSIKTEIIPEKDSNSCTIKKIKGLSNYDKIRAEIGNIIVENMQRFVIKIPMDQKISIVNFYEAAFQLEFQPRFEGFASQNKKEN